MSLNNFNYVHIGNNHISKELWMDVINNDKGSKPIGGLWTSPFNNIEGSISDWTDLLLEQPELIPHHPYEKGCLIKLKDNCNICYLTTTEKIKEIKKLHNMETIDFEVLSKLYDAIYVAPYSMNSTLRHSEFKGWNIRTLLICNLDIIDYYMPIIIEKKEGFIITETKDICTIKDPNEEYFIVCDIIKKLFENKLQKINYSNLTELRKKLQQLEQEIYHIIIEQVQDKISEQSDNYYIIKAILENEKHKQYEKRK